MKNKSIAIASVFAIVLVVGGILAFFTDTDTKTNVFTLGDNVEISLTENWTAEDGLDLHPGAVVTKAPSIKNDSETTPAYVFAEVIVSCYASTGTTVDTPLFTYTLNSGWTLINTPTVNTTSKTITYVYAYGSASAMTNLAADTTTSSAVFDEVTLAPTLTKEQKETTLSEPNIVVNAYGIQVDNLGTTSPSAIYNIVNPQA